jgi:hypothetical protein
MFDSEQEDSWAASALTVLCRGRPELTAAVHAKATRSSCIKRAVLLYCASPGDSAPVFDALADLSDMSAEQRKGQQVGLLREVELDWRGHEELLVKLLRLRDRALAFALIEDAVRDDLKCGELSIGPIEWWLEWLMEEGDTKETFFFRDRLSRLFARHLSAEARELFLLEFNKKGSKCRRILANPILLHRRDLTTDSFGEDAISFLLADLNGKEIRDWYFGNLLGKTATEKFVTERLLPLIASSAPPLNVNLRVVLKQAGSRHGLRYVMD